MLVIPLIVLVGCTEPSDPVDTILLSPNRLSLGAGDTLRLAATLRTHGGRELPDRTITWSSSDTAVATVSGDGLVTGVAGGTAIVRAQSDNRVGAAAVSVSGVIQPGDRVVVDQPKVALIADETVQLRALIVRVGGDTVETTAEWASSDGRVASVTASGLVTATGIGSADISANVPGAPTAVAEVGVAPTFASISAGGEHACGVTTDGQAFCWGAGEFGRLGTGETSDHLEPAPVLVTNEVFTSVQAGGTHTCALTDAGEAECWGGNGEGQLGIGSRDGGVHALRSPVAGGLVFASLSVGADHTCAVTASSVTTCWGSGSSGQLQDLLRTRRTAPDSVGPPAVAVAAGGTHTCAIATQGEPWCWGTNSTSQLGSPTPTGLVTDLTAISRMNAVWGSSSSDVFAVGWQKAPPSCAPTGMVLSPRTSQAVISETEPNDGLQNANPVVLGDTVSGVIDPVGDIDHFAFQAGPGDTLDLDIDAVVNGSSLDAVLTLFDAAGVALAFNDGSGLAAGAADSRIQYAVTNAGTYVAAVKDVGSSGGGAYTYSLSIGRTTDPESCNTNIWRRDGTGWVPMGGVQADLNDVWGFAPDDVFAVGTFEARTGAVFHWDGIRWTLVLIVQGSDLLSVWGSSPTDVFVGGRGSGIHHYDGTGWSNQLSGAVTGLWGFSDSDVWAVTSAGEVLRHDGTNWTASETLGQGEPLNAVWGASTDSMYSVSSGMIGDPEGTVWRRTGGTWTRTAIPLPTDFDFAGNPTLKLSDVWGLSADQVFVSGAINNASVRDALLFFFDGDEWFRVGDLVTGANDANGVWGASPDTVFVATGVDGATTGKIMRFQRGGPAPVSGGTQLARVAAGRFHTCGVTAAGVARCWGDNIAGQAGVGTEASRLQTPTAVAGGHTFAKISAGEFHTCGVTTAGEVYCWGENRSGEVGDGTTTLRRAPVLVEFDEPMASVSAGRAFTCAVSVRGVGYCWGDNTTGQLGDGTTEDRLIPGKVVGPK